MAFTAVTDIHGNDYILNTDCIAVVEPQRGGNDWSTGARIRMKEGIVDRPTMIDLDMNQARPLLEWLQTLR